MTIEERRKEAERLRKLREFEGALSHYQTLWSEQKSDWNGYFLAYCLRQVGRFEEAYEIHEVVKHSYPNFRWINNERLWLDYSAKVKDWSNENFINDANEILSKCDQYNSSTSSIYIKTILAVVKRLAIYKHPSRIQWLDKLDQSILDNKVFRFNNITYPADRKLYFILYADALIDLDRHHEYIQRRLSILGFSGQKHTEFMKYIVDSYTFKAPDSSLYISRTKLALFIKNIQEEIHFKKKEQTASIYSEKKPISVSDCSHFLFCPVSMAINNSYEVYANSSWEKDEWKNEKLYLADRYFKYKQSRDLKSAFDDTQIDLSAEMKDQFNFIFSSELLVNNVTSVEPTICRGDNEELVGAPDYIFKHTSAGRFVVIEKFSHISAQEHAQPFESDLIKPVAFLSSFNDLDLSFGLLINWFWHFEDVQSNDDRVRKKIVIRSYRINKVVKKDVERRRVVDVIAKVQAFRKAKVISIDGNRVSYPNKCLNCSVVSYCNHKTGVLNQLELPYKIGMIKGA